MQVFGRANRCNVRCIGNWLGDHGSHGERRINTEMGQILQERVAIHEEGVVHLIGGQYFQENFRFFQEKQTLIYLSIFNMSSAWHNLQ